MLYRFTSSTLRHTRRPFAEHAGGGRRSVQRKRSRVSCTTDFIVRIFRATQVDTDRTQHISTYRRKNGTLIRERTLTGGSAACRRLPIERHGFLRGFLAVCDCRANQQRACWHSVETPRSSSFCSFPISRPRTSQRPGHLETQIRGVKCVFV